MLDPANRPLCPRQEIRRVAPALTALWRLVETSIISATPNRPSEDALQVLKKHARAMGQTEVGWRYLCVLGLKHGVLLTGMNHEKLPQRLLMINRLALTGLALPSDDLLLTLRCVHDRHTRNEIFSAEVMATFLRAALLESTRRLDNISQFTKEVRMVGQWVSDEFISNPCRQPLDKNQRRATWAWFYRHARTTRPVAFMRLEQNWPIQWDSLVTQHEYYGHEVIALTTLEMLVGESDDMHNCVREYWGRCAVGGSRVFSIRWRGDVRATLELARRNDRWAMKQLRGYRNTRASPDLVVIAKHVRQRYQAAWERSSADID